MVSGQTTLWTRTIGTSGNDEGSAIACDSTTGAVYVTGVAHGGGLNGQTLIGGRDLYLVKYSSNGTRIWTKQTGSTADDYGRGVCVDSSGFVYVTGY
eukprot:gene45870-56141_t